MNWLVRRIVDGYRALSTKMYARRYGTMVRQMGHEEIAPPQEDEAKRGFIVIQIDGLAYDHLYSDRFRRPERFDQHYNTHNHAG